MVFTVTFFRTKIWLNGQMDYGHFSYIKRLNFFFKRKKKKRRKREKTKKNNCLAMLCYSQSGNHPQEHVAKFGYKPNTFRNLKKVPSIFWLPA